MIHSIMAFASRSPRRPSLDTDGTVNTGVPWVASGGSMGLDEEVSREEDEMETVRSDVSS